MGVNLGVRGQSNLQATAELVRRDGLAAQGGQKPAYEAIREYVFAGRGTGQLRVKYGNHDRELQLGTKGLFARGNRDDLTVEVFKDIIKDKFGSAAAEAFVQRCAPDGKRSGINLTKAHMRDVIEDIEEEFGVAGSVAAEIDPADFNPAPVTEAQVRADLGENWSMADRMNPLQAVTMRKEAGLDTKEYDGLDLKTPAMLNKRIDMTQVLPADLLPMIPEQVGKDINRARAVFADGTLMTQYGAVDGKPDNYLEMETGKWLDFFESATKTDRADPDFKNMFRNFARNFCQAEAGFLYEKMARDAGAKGMTLMDFMIKGGEPEGNTSVRVDGPDLVIDRSVALKAHVRTAGQDLRTTMTESFRLPIESLRQPESTFDAATAVVAPVRTFRTELI